MRSFFNNAITFTAHIFMLFSLVACGESEVEKAARKQNEANDSMEKFFHVIEPKGNHPKY